MRATCEGPIDTARRLNAEAEEIDLLIAEYKDFAPPDIRDIQDMLRNLDRQHPLMNQEVIVYGTELTGSVDDDGGMMPLAVPPYEKSGRLHGTYAGFWLRNIYDSVTDQAVPSVVHMINTGTLSYEDEFFNYIHQTNYGYVPVQGSEVVPVWPRQAHSLRDLHGDGLLREIDKLAFDERLDPAERLSRVVAIANAALRIEEIPNDSSQQRISYINSLGLLDDLMVLTRELVIVDCDKYGPRVDKTSCISDLSMQMLLEPDILVAANSYQRRPDGTFDVGMPLEVFGYGESEEGAKIMTPLARATGIYLAADVEILE